MHIVGCTIRIQNGYICLFPEAVLLKVTQCGNSATEETNWFKAVAKVWFVTLRHGRCDVKRLQK